MKTSFQIIALSFVLFSSFNAYSQAASEEKKVYRTKSGTKYHTVCRYAKSEGAKMITLQAAEAAGLTKCSICHKAENTDPTEDTTTSVQCQGKTTKGERCKLKTSDITGYCHHHRQQASK